MIGLNTHISTHIEKLATPFTFARESLERSKKMEEEIGRTSEEGSRQLVFAAVGKAGEEDSLRGQYIDISEVREVSDFVLEELGVKVQNLLWVSGPS